LQTWTKMWLLWRDRGSIGFSGSRIIR
jgi:hypothetical protein